MKRAFETNDDFKNKFIEYIEYCDKNQKLQNIAGFCVYCDINRDTYYAQKDYYSDTYKKVELFLEDSVINNKHISPTEKIFYLKSKFGYIDKQVIDNNITSNGFNIKIVAEDD